MFNILFNDIFDITDKSGLYNFADDNNLSAIGDTVEEPKSTLKQQTTDVLKWFDENHLIANPEKFHLMFLLPNKTDQAMNEQLFINNITLDSEPSITIIFFTGKLNENIGKPKELWKSLKSLGLPSKKSSCSTICLEKDGILSFDPKANAEIFKDFIKIWQMI